MMVKINRRRLSFAGLGAALTRTAMVQGNHQSRRIRVSIAFSADGLPEPRGGADCE